MPLAVLGDVGGLALPHDLAVSVVFRVMNTYLAFFRRRVTANKRFACVGVATSWNSAYVETLLLVSAFDNSIICLLLLETM